jgi:hypothetical protein
LITSVERRAIIPSGQTSSRLFLDRADAEAHLREAAAAIGEKMRQSVDAFCRPPGSL